MYEDRHDLAIANKRIHFSKWYKDEHDDQDEHAQLLKKLKIDIRALINLAKAGDAIDRQLANNLELYCKSLLVSNTEDWIFHDAIETWQDNGTKIP